VARTIEIGQPDLWAGEPVEITPLMPADGPLTAGGSSAVRRSAPPSSVTTTVGSATATPSGWRRDSSGVLVPIGALVTSRLSGDSLDVLRADLTASSDRRGVRAFVQDQRGKRLSAWSELTPLQRRKWRASSELHELCSWLAETGLDIIGSITYSDPYAAAPEYHWSTERGCYVNHGGHGILSIDRALKDVRQGLREVPMKRGAIHGFQGKFANSGEWHPSGRIVPHVHLALDSMGAPIEAVCGDLYRYFSSTRGRSRFEPMRDCDEATLYGLKDTVKASASDANALDLRLHRTRKFRGRR
jgi:hypothetical protein